MQETIQLAHGGGGRLTRELIDQEIVSRFGGGALEGLPDAATLPRPGHDLVFTTDSFVVTPFEFPGGNIGDLAVHGTVNDIAVAGGAPRWLSLALILEEGLSVAALQRVLDAVKTAADFCGVDIVTGDTKVVARGQGDGIYVNTAGIGERIPGFELGTARIQDGDQVLINGTIAEHGLAVLAAREEIHIAHGPRSDSAPVHRLVAAVADLADEIRFMRDPTRGGLAAVLNELVDRRPFGIALDEEALPISHGVRGVSEMLGLDPLHVASEGRLVLVCSAAIAGEIVRRWQRLENGADATVIGQANAEAGRVTMTTLTGGRRLVDVPRGELLPRIC